MSKDLNSLEQLLLATSFEELTSAALANVHRLGFDYFLYGVRSDRATGPIAPFNLRGCLTGWRDRYQARGYENIDPLVTYSATRYVPLIWNDEFYVKSKAVMLYEDAMDFGLKSGITFPMYGPKVKVAFVSLISKHHSVEPANNIAATLGSAQLLACYLHETFQKIEITMDPIVIDGKILSARERECLQWCADGKTSWEIARILALSERTIVFHLANAAGKLGAINRRQAVVRAIALGLVTL